MTTWRLWPATNGPAPTAFSGTVIVGTGFAVAGGSTGYWLNGYWWWVAASGQDTTPVKCALWSSTATGGQGALVPNSVVTSGTLTAGQWNFIPLPAPLQLAPGWDTNSSLNGSVYIAAVGYTVAQGFPITTGYWGTGGPGTNGITNGPLVAYSANVTNGNATSGATLNAPNVPQSQFTFAGADPSLIMPSTASGTSNFWVDVQISDTPPAGFAGTYRLWPNKFDANPATTGDLNVNYAVGNEIHLAQNSTLNNVWYFSPALATTFATRCDVWSISSGTSVAGIASPAWLTPAGSAAAPGSSGNGQWVKAAFPAGVTIPAGQYRVSVYNSAGSTDSHWNPKDAVTDYWGETLTGVGANGITSGPVSAPKFAAAAPGFFFSDGAAGPPPNSGGPAPHAQSVFFQGAGTAGPNGFPQLFAPVGAGTNETQNYWVDLEITPAPASPAAPAGVAGDDSRMSALRKLRWLG